MVTYLPEAPVLMRGIDVVSTFGEWLMETRQKRGMSQRGLAAKAGISQAMASKVESGGGLSVEMARRLADALDVPRSEAERAWAASNFEQELTRVPDLSIIQSIEGYNDLDGEYRQAAEDEIRQVIEEEGEPIIEKWLRKQRRRESIGGTGES